jgi:hypothetical protein
LTDRKPGRPPIGDAINVRLPAELVAALDKRAAQITASRGTLITRSDLIRIGAGWATSAPDDLGDPFWE